MTATLTLGGFTLAAEPLIAGVVLTASLALAPRLAGTHAQAAARSIWLTAGIALLVARLSSVWRFSDAYLASPWQLLNLRDGGWDGQAGVIAAWLFALWWLSARPQIRRPVLVTLAVGSVLWMALSLGTIWLQRQGDGPLPHQPLQSLDGNTHWLSAYRGKPVVVNLWATWCPPCRREMPLLMDAQRSRQSVHFVFVNQGESPGQVAAFLRRMNLPLQNVLLDPTGSVAAALEVRAYPTTLFFDENGKLIRRSTGELTPAALERLLARPDPLKPPAATGK